MSSRLNALQLSSSHSPSSNNLEISEFYHAADGSTSATTNLNLSTERLLTSINTIFIADMESVDRDSVDSLASRPHTYRQLVIIDDITYFQVMYAKV